MQKALAIARREVHSRSFVFVTALVLTLAPLLALVIPRGTFEERMTTFGVLSLVVAVSFTGGLSTVLGTSLVGRELTEKRLSFYFSRPVSAAQIWFGKLTGAMALIFGCAAIVFLPSVFFVPQMASWMALPVLAADVAVGALFLLTIGHTLSTMIRSRSAWFAVDVVAAILFKVSLAAMLMPLLFHGASMVTRVILVSVTVAFIVTIAAGGAWQLARGRIDIRRNHRELSKFLWISFAAVLLLVFGVTTWIESAGVNDLDPRSQYRHHAPGGTWTFVTGRANHRLDYRAAFLYDEVSRTSIPVPGQFDWAGAFNQSGTAAVWVEPTNPIQAFFSRHVGPTELLVTRLAPDAKPVRTGIVIDGLPRWIDATSDASRVAVIAGNVLTVYDVATGKSLASVRAADGYTRFDSPDVLWIWSRTKTSDANWLVRVDRFDVSRHALKTVFETTARGTAVGVNLGRDNRTVIVRTWNAGVGRVPDPSPELRQFALPR